jgi:hypothetical protein
MISAVVAIHCGTCAIRDRLAAGEVAIVNRRDDAVYKRREGGREKVNYQLSLFFSAVLHSNGTQRKAR